MRGVVCSGRTGSLVTGNSRLKDSFRYGYYLVLLLIPTDEYCHMWHR